MSDAAVNSLQNLATKSVYGPLPLSLLILLASGVSSVISPTILFSECCLDSVLTERMVSMSTKKITQPAQNRFSSPGQCQTTPFSQIGHLGSLFEKLAADEMPNFLEIMSALSEIAYEITNDNGHCIDCKTG